jgi:hypothetical protein
MNRTNVFTSPDNPEDIRYIGWFDMDRATILAKHKSGNPYTYYSWLYLTAGGKLILESSSNCGLAERYAPCSAKLAVQLIIAAGTPAGEAWLDGQGADELAAAEIK